MFLLGIPCCAAEEASGDRVHGKKAIKAREPFEVPTGGAFWLHDDRFGEEPAAAAGGSEVDAEPSEQSTG